MFSRILLVVFSALIATAHASAQPEAPSAAEAWSNLHTAASSKNVDTRIQAVTALSVIGTNRDAEQMLRAAFYDPEIDVRLAAIIAAGETKDRNLRGDLRKLLDDDAPQVAFTAATTLWKMTDQSGEDILLAVMRGERKANPNFMTSATHSASRTLHKPAELLRIGATQAASILVPPVGYGMGAYRYLEGASKNPRVQALELLAKQEHNEHLQAELIDATDDKDEAVRLAAAEELSHYPGKATLDALSRMFGDKKTAVHLMASASYIRAAGGRAGTRRHK